jgi:cephalosporin hydroxylase
VRESVAAHPLGDRVTVIEADSAADTTLTRVRDLLSGERNVMVVLDSDHSRAHVRRELEAYHGLVPPGGWLVAFDGIMQWIGASDVNPGLGESPSWVEDNPLPAIREFVREHPEFEVTDRAVRLGATFAPEGYLRRRPS